MDHTFVSVKVFASVAGLTEVQGKLGMRVRKDEPTDSYLGFMPALKLYAQGRTPQEAERLMEKTVALYLEIAIRDGQLDSILLERGFRRLKHGDKTPDMLSLKRLSASQPAVDREMEFEFAGAN